MILDTPKIERWIPPFVGMGRPDFHRSWCWLQASMWDYYESMRSEGTTRDRLLREATGLAMTKGRGEGEF